MSRPVNLVLKYTQAQERAGRLTAGTAKHMRWDLFRWLRTCPDDPRRITTAHVQHYLDTKPAPATKRRTLSFIRGFCRWCVLEGHMRSDPTLKVPTPKMPRSAPRRLTHHESTSLTLHAPDARTALVLSLMLQEGLRRAEVAAIQWGDVDTYNRTLGIRGKGGRNEITRYVPLSDETLGALEKYVDQYPIVAGPLVRRVTGSGTGRPLSPHTIGRLVTSVLKDSGVKVRAHDGKSPHALRHTALSDMVEHGAPIQAVQRAAGHQSISTTQIYTSGVDPQLRTWMAGRKYQPGSVEGDRP